MSAPNAYGEPTASAEDTPEDTAMAEAKAFVRRVIECFGQKALDETKLDHVAQKVMLAIPRQPTIARSHRLPGAPPGEERP